MTTVVDESVLRAARARTARSGPSQRRSSHPRRGSRTGAAHGSFARTPYALAGGTLQLDVGAALQKLGLQVLSQELLPCEPGILAPELDNHGSHWQYGKEILASAHWVARQPAVYPIYLTYAHCGPHAMLAPLFRETMDRVERPFAVLKFDPQASDAGLITRLEAAVETFRDHHARRREMVRPLEPSRTPLAPIPRLSRQLTFLAPGIDEMVCRLWSALFRGDGYSVKFFELSPEVVAEGQRYTTGGECLAIPSIVGGAVTELRSTGWSGKAVFVPTSTYSCVYPEFSRAIRRGLDQAGFREVPVCAPNLFAAFPGASNWVNSGIWECVVAVDLLRRAAFESRSSEVTLGATARCIERILSKAEATLHRKGRLRPVIRTGLRELATIARDDVARPRVLVVGNMFMRFNPLLTGGVIPRLEALGAQIVSSPMSDYTLTARLQNKRLLQEGTWPWRWRAGNTLLMTALQAGIANYEKLTTNGCSFAHRAPGTSFADLERWTSGELGIPWALGGETLSVLGRVLQAVDQRQVDAVVHINSLFCQPANVSEALLDSVLRAAGVPFLNLFFNGADETPPPLEPLVNFLRPISTSREETIR